MKSFLIASVFYFLTLALLPREASAFQSWTRFNAGTDASFRGLDVVSDKVIWASGTGGTVIRTIDGGATWKVFKVPGAEELDFRDIEAFGENTAYILSIGNGGNSRIYKTTDGGGNWELQFTNPIENAFFDSIAFWDEDHGIAQSDPVDGNYVFYVTDDGSNWERLVPARIPPAGNGEAAFAASGTCVVTRGTSDVFLITGGSDARVLFSRDRGMNWIAASTPLVRGSPAAGIFGLALFEDQAAIVGGDYTKPAQKGVNFALASNGPFRWSTLENEAPFGYRSGIAFVDRDTLVAVGSGGSDMSTDGGRTWENIDEGNYNAVGSSGFGSIWAVGPNGMVARLEIARLDLFSGHSSLFPTAL